MSKGPLWHQNYYGYEKSSGNYDEDFVESFSVWTDYNAELLKRSFDVGDNCYYKAYSEAGVRRIFTGNEDIDECYKKELSAKIINLKSLLARADLMESVVSTEQSSQQTTQASASNRIFIVHGHDESFRSEVELFVIDLGFDPIILCKEASGGDTIIEKIERYAAEASFAIVLYTACDIGADKDKQEDKKFRARQNVVFEHGFMCAKLGREHVCAIIDEDVEKPGDIDGVVYISKQEEWKIKLAKEMNAAGLDVNLNKLLRDYKSK